MHLNKDYEAIRGQILHMDPLPSISKACLMIEKIEQQRQVTGGVTGAREIAAVDNRLNSTNYTGNFKHVTGSTFNTKNNSNIRFKRDNKKVKNARFYGHCQRTGHTMDQCFKLIDYPYWYDISKNKNKGKESSKVAAHVYTQNSNSTQDTPLEESSISFTNSNSSTAQFDPNMVQALAQEMAKLLKGK